jgi:hypothetical protein
MAQDANSNGGTFTLTNIPSQYNGKYAMLLCDNAFISGLQSIDIETEPIILVRISNGGVNLPLWIEDRGKFVRYSGNHITWGIVVITDSKIYQDEHPLDDPIVVVYFESITFSNGHTTKSWNDGVVDSGEFE